MDYALGSPEPRLYYAIRDGNTTIFNHLIAQPAHRANLNRDEHVCSGFKLLSAAIRFERTEIVKTLISLPTEVFDFSEHSVIHLGWLYRNLAILKIIVETGKVDITERDEYGRTPFHHACHWGGVETIDYLLNAGVNPDEKDNSGCTPFADAVWACKIDNIYRLLEIDGVNPDTSDNRGRTPFYWAVYHDDDVIVDILTDSGRVNITVEDRAIQDAGPLFC